MLKFHPISSELSVYCVKVKRIINDLEPKNSQLIKALCWEMKIFCIFEGFIYSLSNNIFWTVQTPLMPREGRIQDEGQMDAERPAPLNPHHILVHRPFPDPAVCRGGAEGGCSRPFPGRIILQTLRTKHSRHQPPFGSIHRG